MSKIGLLPILILSLNIVLFFGWTITFSENEWIGSVGVSLLQSVGGILSLIWLLKASQKVSCKHRNFWRLLSIGMSFYLSSNLLWLYVQLSQKATQFNETSFLLWLVAYVFFLAALINKVKEISRAISNSSYIFNIVIFMITAAAIAIHYLIQPIIVLSNHSFLVTVTTVAYTVTSMSILFVTTILYYFIKHSKDHDLLLYIVIGFFLQVIADSSYAYLSATQRYHAPSMIDLFWLVSILFIGFAGYYARENKAESKWKIKNPFNQQENFFPYSSIVILIGLVIYAYHWDFNALSLGLLIVILLVIGRQLYVINKNKKLMDEYKFLAYHDSLTGLTNRASFKEDLLKLMSESPHSRTALLLIDLDRFKVINDTLGHLTGDKILIETAERLKETLERDTPIYRLGGDEFVIILSDTTETQCSIVAENLLVSFQKPILVDDHEIIITPSIGISIVTEQGSSSEDLFKHADAAMNLVKENGKNNFRFFTDELNQSIARKMKIENALQKAIEREQFSLFYQPKVDLLTNHIIGMEALLRWEHPKLGWVSPAEFIPIAEETGHIVKIGEWVLKTACKQNKIWEESGYTPLCVSVNVSVRQFQHREFIKSVREVLQETKLNPQFLELEITESIMQNIKESTEILNELKRIGVKTSIDDFGKGYSSLHILQKLPIDTIKIDKSFIDEIGSSKQQSVIKTIIDLGINLDISVVAEGIEHEHQLKVLLENKCRIGQGYLFSKAVEPREFEEILLQNEFRAVV